MTYLKFNKNSLHFILILIASTYLRFSCSILQEDGSDYQVHNSTFSNVTLCAESDCRTRNTLSAIAVQNVTDGKLRRKRALGEGRIFGASFQSESTLPNIKFAGRYKLIVSTPGS